MRAELIKIRAYGRRVLTAVMAAACLCTMGCTDIRSEAEDNIFQLEEPSEAENIQSGTMDNTIESAESPGADNIQSEAEDGAMNSAELTDVGFTKVVYISMDELATPEPAISYPGVNISYSQEITAYATDSSIYMRVRPDKSSDDDNIVKKVEDTWGKEFYLLGITGDWYYARYTEDGVDYIGFVRKDDFYTGEVAPTPTPKPVNRPQKEEKDDKKEDKKQDDKGNKKEEGKSEPTPTPSAKKVGKTPYSNKYSKVSIKYEGSSEGIKFETTTLDGDTVSDSLFSRNGLTMVNIWTQT